MPRLVVFPLLCSLLATGCPGDDSKLDDTAPDSDADTDSDSDADTDSDSDSDADCDAPEIAWTLIPAGTFMMGSPESEVGRDKDEVQHEVTLTRDFYIGTNEITIENFVELAGYQPSHQEKCADCPVENVTWYEAMHYANLLSACSGLSSCYRCEGELPEVTCELLGTLSSPYECEGYRLPTEAEWEYAYRAGSTGSFPDNGDLYEGEDYNCDGKLLLTSGNLLDDQGWYCGNSGEHSWPIGLKTPTPWGLLDMGGNVMEWTADVYGDYTGDAVDPWAGTGQPRRVFRGGSMYVRPSGLRAANRSYDFLTIRLDALGFRLVRSSL